MSRYAGVNAIRPYGVGRGGWPGRDEWAWLVRMRVAGTSAIRPYGDGVDGVAGTNPFVRTFMGVWLYALL
jgi:hypothetical protein